MTHSALEIICPVCAARRAENVTRPLKEASRAQKLASSIVYLFEPRQTTRSFGSRLVDCLYGSRTFLKLLRFWDKALSLLRVLRR
ncbi:MAG: hypothetical protein ACOH2N_18750 [Devosia sp.]